MLPPKSKHPGVSWHAQKSKWRGDVYDRSVRVGKKPKQTHFGFFVDERACAEAVAAKQAEIDASIAVKLHAMAQELPHTRDLPPMPAKAADAEPHTAYYGEKRKGTKGEDKAFEPQRYVRVASKSAPGGFEYAPCCHANLVSGAPCTHVTCQTSDSVFCHTHGGAPKAGEGPLSHYCSVCRTMEISKKRMVRNGGNGMCPTCERHRTAEAAANGATTSIKANERWEEVVFTQLLPLITYADGTTPFPPDQRDERRGGGLGTPKTQKRRRECDTTTNRYPDCLWVVRDERARAVLVVTVEVDEHSHTDRDPECETGKIDDTFQSLQDKLAKEGAARGAVARHDAEMIPIVTIRMNPNKYDKAQVRLADRVKAVAAVVRAYLHMDAETRDALQTHAPIVHVMYYHTKEGAKHLAHYAAWATEAGWEYTVH
ncbi:MAG: hypothetical protein CMB11_04830 [Euryarchaeota archaeon]|nr:hypothetical protein [Euryarchaeota archaeon]